jgi:hypothetical protein
MGRTQYFLIVNDRSTDQRPRGVLRRLHREDASTVDERYDFERDGWIATDFFLRRDLGLTDQDNIEVTSAAAAEVIAEVRVRRRERGL